MARYDDALARHQRRVVRSLVHLGDRPQRHVVGRSDRLQRVAGTGDHRHAAVPQLDFGLGGNDVAQRHRLAPALRRGPRELRDLGQQLGVDLLHLFDVDVGNLVMLRKIEAGIVALVARRRLDIAATQNALRQKDVDEAFDIERHAVGGVRWIDGNDQADRDVFSL